MAEISIEKTIEEFIANVEMSRSPNTAKTYHNAMHAFLQMLLDEKKCDENADISIITEESAAEFSKYLKYYSATTESLYINVFKNYLEFLASQNYLQLNMYQIKILINQRSRKPGVRLPQFPQEDIEKVINYALSLEDKQVDSEPEYLINLRDGAFLVTLADTGLRIHEACNLRRGDIDWSKQKAIIIGKGNKQAVVRFSNRSIIAMRSYLKERQNLDGLSGRPLSSMPIFARHDKGAGKNIIPMTTKTGRLIVSQRVEECLGKDAVGTITPHSFRHYFVTCVLRETNNLKIAQEFARHTNIAVTQRYAHLANNELDDTYHDIFD